MIHTDNEIDRSRRVRALLEQMGVPVGILPVISSENTGIKQFTAFFDPSTDENQQTEAQQAESEQTETQRTESQQTENQRTESPTHVIILSSLSRHWFDFLAGFSFGSGLPLLVYGQEAVAGISGELSFCFTFVETEASLQAFFQAESEASRKHEAARVIIEARETLLKMGVPVTGESLSQCAGEGRLQEVSLFLAAGFSPDTRNKAGVPLLCMAARKGKREVIRFLFAAGAQVNLQADDRGTTALMESVMGKYYDLAMDLITAGADVNLKSKDGQTALVVAVGAGQEKIVEALLKAGADPDIPDSLGASARKYAALFHKKSIQDLFDTYAPLKGV
ncbi:MAG: ankyrin repeat domain-containing protein [Treponema sp.]|nr:ankyrin repeat domain-containing protein [Treponema sp.]